MFSIEDWVPIQIRRNGEYEDVAEEITETIEEAYNTFLTFEKPLQEKVVKVRKLVHRHFSRKKRITDRVKMTALAVAYLVFGDDDENDPLLFSLLLYGQAGGELYDIVEKSPAVYGRIVKRWAKYLRKQKIEVNEENALRQIEN